jgi:hypothetical protein
MRCRMISWIGIFVALALFGGPVAFVQAADRNILVAQDPGAPAAVEPAPPAGGVAVQRAGHASQILSAERIAALKPFTQRAPLGPGAGERGNEWTGPLLWDVIVSAGLIDAARPREQAHLAVRVTGADGYAAVVAVGEISPQFADRKIQLADRFNGMPLPNNGLRLIVPDDNLGGRSVRDVVRIDVE